MERIDPGQSNKPVTQKQRDMAEQLLREFPSSRELFEYQDYAAAPTRGNASRFITRAIEDNLNQIAQRENYLDYIANRPRVQRLGAHGLFTGGQESLSLSQVADEVARHPGTVWLPIISLRREDAARLGFDHAERWRQMLSEHAADMAAAMKIPAEQFRWYAAFHDEGRHPHVHMVCYSADGRSGFLTKNGIAQIRSILAQSIFQQDLISVYQQQTQYRDELMAESRETLKQLVSQMQTGTLENSRIEQLMSGLVQQLRSVTGKKQYGYLKASLRSLVDEIVNELARDPRIAAAYDLWCEQREEILRTYKDDLPERLPLSEQPEFRHLKNAIIKEAVRLEQQTTADTYIPGGIQISASHRKPTSPSDEILTSATRLLRHMSRTFPATSAPVNGLRVDVDSKLRRRIREKKLAMGHKPDDHEQTLI